MPQDTSSNILTRILEDDNKMKMLMMNSRHNSNAETTGGATGGELNNAGAEFVAAGNPTGGGNVNIMNEA